MQPPPFTRTISAVTTFYPNSVFYPGTVVLYPNSVFYPGTVVLLPKQCLLSGKCVFLPKQCLLSGKCVIYPGIVVIYPEIVVIYPGLWSFTRDSQSGHVCGCRLCADTPKSKHPFGTHFGKIDSLSHALHRRLYSVVYTG